MIWLVLLRVLEQRNYQMNLDWTWMIWLVLLRVLELGFIFNPRVNRRLALACTISISCSLDRSSNWSRSTPRNMNFLKVLFFFNSIWAASSAILLLLFSKCYIQ